MQACHLIMARRQQGVSLDYPKLKAGHAIADSICWLVMPDLFFKDNHQALPTLIGSGELTEAGLKTSDLASGAAWPQPSDIGARVSGNKSYSIIWRGNLEAASTHGSFVSIPWHDGDWVNPYGWLRFARDSSKARLSTYFAKDSTTYDDFNHSDPDTLQTDQHLYAVTYDGSVITFYRDNIVIGSNGDSSNIASSGWSESDIFLCVNQEGFGEGIKAHSVNLCLIADRALTAAEIAAISTDRMQLIDTYSSDTGYDYPAIATSSSLGSDVVWLYDASYEKDSQQTPISLSGNASRSGGEVSIQSLNRNGAIAFASEFDMSQAVNGGVSFAWEGKLSAWGDDSTFIELLAGDGSSVGGVIKHPDNAAHKIWLFDVVRWGWAADQTTAGLVLLDGQPHQYVWILDFANGNVATYRDGAFFGGYSYAFSISAGKLVASVQLAANINGAVRRALVVDRVITAQEAAQLYNNPGSILLN